jgi:hypothetical protein
VENYLEETEVNRGIKQGFSFMTFFGNRNPRIILK